MLDTKRNGIYGFNGEYRWLSNFWPCRVKNRAGVVFSTVEAAYQWAKSSDPGQADRFAAMTAKDAKAAGRSLRLRPDWEFVKDDIMLALLRQKFGPENPDLRHKLVFTHHLHLEETNTWNDKYWGVCGGVGKNRLGELLMKVRYELREANKKSHTINRIGEGQLLYCPICKGGEVELFEQSCVERLKK